ncbi:hypothetical protein DPM19_11990 [Actinomadura craniellae]|uniref:Peptidase inhibitor family I36 protein n=1 Tax=Actinomadura craniellae TaxID=2231787 RepID=A0A365H8J6_9ACTN|nr:peptidase inhibitor family I36 protein [Actinomadura craniellae]RAY15407.1 hypothetical protein DPM19_11990 [Actinomadura craniellae]
MRPIRAITRTAIARTAVTCAVVISVGAAMSTTAHAGTPDGEVQRQVATQIAAHGGTQTGPGEITYRNGAVKLIIPSARQAATCPGGWYCFFQYSNYRGRMLQFQDCGGDQFLGDYGFRNYTTSWQNHTGHTVEVFDEDVQPWKLLWTEHPTTEAVSVGTEADNRADFFTTYCA